MPAGGEAAGSPTARRDGRLRAIGRELDAIEESQGRYLAFVRRMREMAAEYDMGRIVDFLRASLGRRR
ncbi:MAG: hypothetical protein LJE70_18060 [Chromatiaceae bacterium]|jgi:hypothetical protein|nr:hypothetical protein [Chromatiaceae bacterium]